VARRSFSDGKKVSGDGTYIAINNIHFAQGPAKIAPQLAWEIPDALLVGSPLGATELNATANVPGTFSYTPPPGTVLPAGVHMLAADFIPADGLDICGRRHHRQCARQEQRCAGGQHHLSAKNRRRHRVKFFFYSMQC
jgi:hypothetical protein